ncbi:hypothetical protein SCHPADRAFT_886874 [Schizopora paradoxa]|uniref:Uncharacterized protein n=1 Tax=Schizopora paradoxa TaxID=27342 RepID=A0A0H2RZM7_9AGAM|nr:hypothetical protein SCHPADRAFT_886874 [Schizopora paradoxa]
MKLVTPTSLFFFALLRWALGKNDWTKACLSGLCTFDTEEGLNTMGGTIEISGSPSAISDITPAAGWDILNCTDSTNNQTIVIVCTDESLECDHIFQGSAEDTIIRLPEHCGSGPFVRVAEHWIPNLDSLSPDKFSKIKESSAQVHALRIDDNFEGMSRRPGPLLGMAKRRRRQNDSGFENVTTGLPISSVFTLFEIGDQPFCPSPMGAVSRGTMSPPSITSLNFSAPTMGNIVGSFGLIEGSLGTFIINTVDMEVVNMAFPLQLTLVGLLQSQTNLQERVNVEININNLQFNYPTDSPPAIVDIDITPAADTPVFQILVEVSAFTQFVDLSIFQNLGQNTEIATTPSDGNNEEVCVNVTNSFSVSVSNSGPFFQAFEAAGSLQLFDGVSSVVSSCKVVPLGPSPPITRFARSPLYGRDTGSCPPATAISQNPITFLGSQAN